MEIRYGKVEVECRDDGSYKIGGYVNATERESELLYSSKRKKWFKEVVKQGAFTRSLSSGKEIPLLLEHDETRRLADNKAGTLTLKEDQIGLRFDAEIRDKEVYEKVKNKQINNCSFGFKPVDQDFEQVDELREKRYLNDLELLEVSLVENPAYAGSLVEVRNLNEQMEILKEEQRAKAKEEDKKENKNTEATDDKKDVKKDASKDYSKANESKKDNSTDKKEDVKKDPKTEEKTNTTETKETKKDPKEKEVETKNTDSKNKESENKDSNKTNENKDPKKSKDVKDTKKEEDPKKKKGNEERGYVEDKVNEINDNVDAKEVVDEIIKEKEEQLQYAENDEKWIKQDLENIKRSNKELENIVESEVIRSNMQVLKLRVQLLKLKSI